MKSSSNSGSSPHGIIQLQQQIGPQGASNEGARIPEELNINERRHQEGSQQDFFEWLESSDHTNMKDNYKAFIITRTISAILSLVASLALGNIIIRSHSGLTTTYNRLLFGLSVSSTICSVAFATSFLMIPKELDYISFYPRGNAISCTVSGYLNACAVTSEALYTLSLCLFSFAVVKMNKNDEYIRRRIEPVLHTVSVFLPFICNTVFLHFKSFNSNGQLCFGGNGYNPPHCWGVEEGIIPLEVFTIPCGRGGKATRNIRLYWKIPATILVLIGIVTMMGLVYKDVLDHEKKMQNYGANAIRRSITIRNIAANDYEDGITTSSSKSTTWCSIVQKVKNRCRRSRRTNRICSNIRHGTNSRAVLHKAFAHSLAWFLTRTIFNIWHNFTSTPGKNDASFFITLLLNLFMPLYGFFNLLIQVYPIVIDIKKASSNDKVDHNSISWSQAFMIALWPKNQDKKRKLGVSNTYTGEQRKRRRSSLLKRKDALVGLPHNLR